MSRLDQGRLEVWCEDREHEDFVRRLFALPNLGSLSHRHFHFNRAPSGDGDAKKWLSLQCATIQGRSRAARHQVNRGFLLVADGDGDGSISRTKSYEGLLARAAQDRIVIWAPTWSIETWILALAGQRGIDESERQKRSRVWSRAERGAMMDAAVENWVNPRDCPSLPLPSLDLAKEELRRLPFVRE